MIHVKQNQYRGVNAHLHSYFQHRGGWSRFHKDHLEDLFGNLQGILPEASAYSAHIVQSIQVAQYDLLPDDSTVVHSGYEAEPRTPYDQRNDLSALPLRPISPNIVLPVTNLFVEEDIKSVVVYKADEPITRIELLSPASKPPGSHHQLYLINRTKILRQGVKLIEIDYLHERRSPVLEVPDYTQKEEGSYPYSIMVSELLSPSGPGYTEVYGFWVEEPIPIIAIPLAGNDVITFDFGAAYHQTFAANSLNGLRIVDYAELPEGFDSYSDVDQERIRVRMELVKKLRE